jgi:hypothetical protein
MHAEGCVDAKRGKRNTERYVNRPGLPVPKSYAGNHVSEAGQEVEPEYKGHEISGRSPRRTVN